MAFNEVICLASSMVVLGMFVACLVLAVTMLVKEFSSRDLSLQRANKDKIILTSKENMRLFFIMLAIVISMHMLQYILGHVMVYGWDLSDFSITSMEQLWLKSDAPHYLGIAEYGYRAIGDARFHIVFFPLYPYLVGVADIIFCNSFLSSLIVSNLALSGACYYIYKLTLVDSDHSSARRSVKYLLLFPVAFFLGVGFSESLFILLIAACLYYARTNKFFLACIIGIFAAFTRMLGIIVIVPILIEALVQTNAFSICKTKGIIAAIKVSWKKWIWILIVPTGTFLYLLINKLVTGDWLTFMVYQREHWYQEFGLFFNNVSTITDMMLTSDVEKALYLWLPELIAIIGVLVVMVFAIRKVRLSYAWFAIIFFFATIAPTWLLSAHRYIMSIVPIYFMLAFLTKNKWVDITLTALFIIGLFYMTSGFVRGMSIY